MGLNSANAGHDSAHGSFASMLERLSRHHGQRDDSFDRDEAVDFEALRGTDAESRSSKRSANRRPTKALPPATERKTGKGKQASDGTQLTYENALSAIRLHRQRANADSKLLHGDDTKVEAGRTACVAASPKTEAEPTMPVQGEQRGRSAAKARSALQSPDSAAAVPEAKSVKMSGRRAQGRAPAQPTFTSALKSISVSGSGREKKNERPADHRLQTLNPKHLSLELAPRRAVVSVRLNDHESQRLRQRAAECGISMSAYMRSCVMDAENLRSQVKQALAELRASGQNAADLPTANRLHTRSETRQASLERTGSGWLRLLARSAEALRGTFLPLRNRA